MQPPEHRLEQFLIRCLANQIVSDIHLGIKDRNNLFPFRHTILPQKHIRRKGRKRSCFRHFGKRVKLIHHQEMNVRKLFFTEFVPETNLCKEQNVLSVNIGKYNFIFLSQRMLLRNRQIQSFPPERYRIQAVLFRIMVQNDDLIRTFHQPLHQLFIAVYNLG